MSMSMMILPHVVVAGRALLPMVLAMVGFQLLIHVNGQLLKALAPNGDDDDDDGDYDDNNDDDGDDDDNQKKYCKC